MINIYNKKIYKISFVIALILSTTIFLAINYKYFSQSNLRDKTVERVYSHRGASGEETEHSFAAYDLAISYGSKYIEQDVVTSKDGTLFVSHDLTAKRLANVDKFFRDMTDSEIAQLKKPDGTPFLKLQDVIDRYGKKVNYVIELKENSKQTDSFLNIISKNKLEDNTVVQSTEIAALNKIASSYPQMRKLLLVKNQDELNLAIASKNVDIVSANKKLMNLENVILVHSKKKVFNIWTLNTAAEIISAIKLDVDSYFTDYTAKAFLLEQQYRNSK